MTVSFHKYGQFFPGTGNYNVTFQLIIIKKTIINKKIINIYVLCIILTFILIQYLIFRISVQI